jgi:hypothetical protein
MTLDKPKLDRKGHLVSAHALNGTPPPPELRARQLTDAQLAQMNHVEWLEDFAKITLLPTRVPMTPRRLGVGTRLQWAAAYIRLLERTLKTQEAELAELRLQDHEAR